MGRRIDVTDTLVIDEDEIEESFVRAGGPGGQHVNKTSSAVQLRFDARNSANLPDDVRQRLEKLAGAKATKDGVIIVTARGRASQALNRAAARMRLVALLRAAARPPKKRLKTKTPARAKRDRIEAKSRRAGVKKLRQPPKDDG